MLTPNLGNCESQKQGLRDALAKQVQGWRMELLGPSPTLPTPSQTICLAEMPPF